MVYKNNNKSNGEQASTDYLQLFVLIYGQQGKEKRRAIIDDTTPKNSNFALSSEGDAGNFCSPQEG